MIKHEVLFPQLGAGPGCSWSLAARVAHSTETDSSEEPTLAESTEITAHVAWRFTASPQGNAVSRRRRALLHTEFVLRERESEREAICDHTVGTASKTKMKQIR